MANQDDFDPKKLLELSAILEQPHKFAKIFCDAADTQAPIHETFQKRVNILIKTDPEVRESLKAHHQEVNRNDYWYMILNGVSFLKNILLLAIGGIITYYLKR